MTRKYTPDKITSLEPNQVFVFGSNIGGFHGAGAAGLACRGDSRNNWREDKWFLDAIDAPVGSPDRVGCWAIYGIGTGYQVGKTGKSYAIPTIKKIGKKKSISLSDILYDLENLYDFAIDHPDLEFLVTKIGIGLAGYTLSEMQGVFKAWQETLKVPDNIILPREYEFRGE